VCVQVELGCTTAFGVPGDFNLLLLDQLLKHPELQMVNSNYNFMCARGCMRTYTQQEKSTLKHSVNTSVHTLIWRD